MQNGADLADHRHLIEVLNNTRFEFTPSKNGMLAKINGVDVTEKIRTPQVTANARYVAACAPARQRLVEMQRQFADTNSRVVSEGRDQGTVAFPDADVKFYLTADFDERVRRRHAELKAKGIEQTIEQIHDAIRQRDDSDEKRFVGPLKPAADALIVDTTGLTIEEVVRKLAAILKDKCSEKL